MEWVPEGLGKNKLSLPTVVFPIANNLYSNSDTPTSTVVLCKRPVDDPGREEGGRGVHGEIYILPHLPYHSTSSTCFGSDRLTVENLEVVRNVFSTRFSSKKLYHSTKTLYLFYSIMNYTFSLDPPSPHKMETRRLVKTYPLVINFEHVSQNKSYLIQS